MSVVSPSLSELLADGMLSSRSGMLSSVARSSLCTTIFNLPFDLSISFLASISDRFSVTVPLICQKRSWSAQELNRQVVLTSRFFCSAHNVLLKSYCHKARRNVSSPVHPHINNNVLNKEKTWRPCLKIYRLI